MPAYAGRMDDEPTEDTPAETDPSSDIASRLEAAEAKIAELLELNAATLADNQSLKARNYDLLSKAPAMAPTPDDTPTEQIMSIDDLFEDED